MKILFSLLTYFSLLFCLPSIGAGKEINQYVLQQLDSRNGLSNSSVNAIFQDSDGLLWIGTYDGLNVYDGTNFYTFNYNRDETSRSIGNNVITKIAEDKYKNIWIETHEGISRYDKQSGKFYNYFYKNNRKAGLQKIIVNEGEIFYFLQEQNKFTRKFDATSETFNPFSFPFEVQQVEDIFFDRNNRLWVLKNGIVEVYHQKDGKYNKQQDFKVSRWITSLFYLNNKVFFNTEGKELYEISIENMEMRKVGNIQENIKAMTFHDAHYIVAWESGGCVVYNDAFQLASKFDGKLKSLQDVQITSFWSSEEEILWIGTDGNGIIKLAPNEQIFNEVSRLSNGTPFKAVRAFNEIDGEVWVGSKGYGIATFQYDSDGQLINDNYSSYTAPAQLENNAVFTIKKGKDDIVYLGTNSPGITLYDSKTRKFIKWGEIENSEKYNSFGYVYSIVQDKDSTIWVATSGYGLIHLKFSRNSNEQWSIDYFQEYAYNGTDSGPASNVIYSLMKGDGDYLWMGCRNGGLSLFDRKTLKFRTYRAFSYEGGLSHNDVLSLYKDSQNRIWVGTSFGLNWIHESDAFNEELEFKKLTTEEGLPNNSIHGIVEDNNGKIWVSTNKGLARIDPLTLEIDRFQQSDGLQSNEFSDGAVWKDTNGTIFFGGVYGFNYVNPEDIHESSRQVNLLVSDLQLGGKQEGLAVQRVLKPGEENRINDFIVDRQEDFFELKLKVIDFVKPEKGQYAYLLEGIDRTWNYAGTDGKISYRNIPPGSHILKVKWTNGEDIWTEEIVLFRFTVKQYWWLSWQAILFYAMVVSYAVYAFVSYRKSKLAIKNQLALEHGLRLKDEEVHQERLSFFTNIAHELQTPLTLISGSVEQYIHKNNLSVKTDEKQYFLSLIQQHSSRLNYLVTQILEFRKAEGGHLKNNYSYIDLSTLLANIAGFFAPLRDHKDSSFSLKVEPGIIGWTDKDKLEKIIFNLLSNSFKHTDVNQEIIFSVSENKATSMLEVTVANSGFKLSQENVEQLFDRFFVVDAVQKDKYSFGIGLAFTKQLVKLLKGQIEAKSENNWIIFNVKIPIASIPGITSLSKNNVLLDTPSHILHSLGTYPEKQWQKPVVESNKLSFMKSLEQKEKQSILLVEDEADIRFLLRDILKEDFIIYEADNGKKALELMTRVIPDLIISDIMMPEMNGLELCNRIKETPEACHIPIILLTAKGTMEAKAEGYDAGADAYIPKPFYASYLLVRVRSLLEYRKKLHNLFKKEGIQINIEKEQLEGNDKEFLNNLLQIIEADMDNSELNAAVLEQKLSVSKMQLYRKVKAMTKMTPGEFIKHVRLQNAARLLAETKLTVSEIFYKTGFNNQSYFFREFKKRYECSPGEYRIHQRIQI